MGWFSTPKQLPSNRYGYSPPAGATARGWRCTNDDCNEEGAPAPRRWPARCRACSSQADPLLDEPWNEEAEGSRLNWHIAQEGDEFGHFTNSLFGWRFGQALRWSDETKARAVAAEAVLWVTNFNSSHTDYPQTDPRGRMFYEALAYTNVPLAAEMLGGELASLGDYEAVDFSRIDDNNQSSMRGKWIGFVDRATTLLERPGSASLPHAAAIDHAARYVGSATQHAMGALPVRARWQALMRSSALG